MFWCNVHQNLSISHHHIACVPKFNILHLISRGGFSKAFVGMEEQERVAAQAYRVQK